MAEKLALSWRIMKGAERACQCIAYDIEASIHYGELIPGNFRQIVLWCRGFKEGFNEQSEAAKNNANWSNRIEACFMLLPIVYAVCVLAFH